MISQSTIDRIVDAANIVDVVSEYVTLRRAGASYKGLCPFHDDKTPSFYVSPAKGLCKCFSCGKGGNAVHFIMEQEQLNYYEALKFLAKKYGIEVEERQLTPEQRQSQNERESMYAVNEWASKYFHDVMLNDSDGRSIGLAYFRSRGFRDDIIDKFRLGFCLSQRTAMLSEARKKGYKDEYLVKTGLCYRRDDGSVYDKYFGRVMFPWFSVSGKVVAFGGRVLDARTKGVSQKYINSPESEIFHKSNELYGIFQAKKSIVKEDMVYMVEGYTDVISMHQCGVENVVANSGTALNEAQIRLLHRFTSNITLLYDGDGAGIHAALRGTDMLLAEGMNVKILLLPDGDDPDSFARKHSAAEYKKYIEEHQTDFIIFKTNLLLKDAGRDPLKRAQLVKDIVRSISVIPEEIVRAAYIHECCEILGVDEMMLLRETDKNRAAELERIKKEKERERERAANLANMQKRAKAQQQDSRGSVAETHSESGTGEDAQSASRLGTTDTVSQSGEKTSSANERDSQTDVLQSPSGPWEYPDEPPVVPPWENKEQGTDDAMWRQDIRTASYDVSTRQSREEQRFVGLERMIMMLVVRYGERIVEGVDEQDNTLNITIVEYVKSELDNDELSFKSPLYARMLDEAYLHVGESEFNVSRHFLNSPDIEFSREAADLMSDRYQLSKGQQMPAELETLTEQVAHLMIDYKFEVVEDEMRKLMSRLAEPSVKENPDICRDIMQSYLQLTNVKRKLAKHLGDRVIMK